MSGSLGDEEEKEGERKSETARERGKVLAREENKDRMI